MGTSTLGCAVTTLSAPGDFLICRGISHSLRSSNLGRSIVRPCATDFSASASAVACALTSFSASAAAFLSAAASALACAATTLSASLAADCSAHDTFVFSALAAWSPGIISLDHDNAQVYAVRCGSGVATLVCVFGGLYMYRDRMGGAIFGEKNFLSFSVLKKVLKFLIRIRRARAGKLF